jgi:hypothetical protein
MTLRVRLEDDYEFASSTINSLMHPQHWTADELRQCAVIRITQDDHVGYVWLHLSTEDARTFVAHCVFPKGISARSKFVSLHTTCLARLMGGRYLTSRYRSEREAATYRRLLGFLPVTQDGDRLTLDLE